MSGYNFTCPTCYCSITLSSALPGEQVCCPECNYLFASPPPVGTIRDATDCQTTGLSSSVSANAPAGTIPPNFFADLNAPPPLPAPEIVSFDNTKKKLSPTPSAQMGAVAFLLGKIGAFIFLVIIVIGVVSVGIWKAKDAIAGLQNQISLTSDKKYHCPACGVTAPATVDVCASCGFEFEPVENHGDNNPASPPADSIVKNLGNRIKDGLRIGKKTTRVTITAGDAIIIDDKNGMSSVEIQYNDGTVIEANWQRNSANEFGYDIYPPKVNRSTNRLAVMISARSVITNYLNGKYP